MTSQTLKTQVTVTAGNSTVVTFPVPQGARAFLTGYGYDYFASTTYQLNVSGQAGFPTRTDQEGSIAQPMTFGSPIPLSPGGNIEFSIANGDASDHDYQVMMVIITDRVFPYNSTGGAIVQQTSSASGTGNSVAIYDSTFTNVAPVTTSFGLGVDVKPPSTVNTGATSTSGASAVVLGSSTSLKRGVLVQSAAANAGEIMLVGNASTQVFELASGESVFIEANNLNLVYIKRNGSVNVTANYIAV